VLTIEINPIYAGIAHERLRRAAHATIFIGESVEVLRQLADAGQLRRPFCYLDAHSNERVPLPDELKVIASATRDAIVIIDDFFVPDDPGYGYDIYNGVPLALNALELPNGFAVGYPAISAKEETGARRGTLYAGVGDGADCIATLVREHRLVSAAGQQTRHA
jgi:hypothetical protein